MGQRAGGNLIIAVKKLMKPASKGPMKRTRPSRPGPCRKLPDHADVALGLLDAQDRARVERAAAE